MIEAIEHDYSTVGILYLREEMDARGGINGWTLIAATKDQHGICTLFWSRTCPAAPNLGSEG